jgi:hypothetical protein
MGIVELMGKPGTVGTGRTNMAAPIPERSNNHVLANPLALPDFR